MFGSPEWKLNGESQSEPSHYTGIYWFCKVLAGTFGAFKAFFEVKTRQKRPKSGLSRPPASSSFEYEGEKKTEKKTGNAVRSLIFYDYV